ncbi:MAG: hypothetical protein QOF62_1148 [Pyrinomonadaceae bacterium]|jgi:hypothetical protein|nr:hypothetical protein [Pyrinomonadaceae bacterium]
MRVGEAIMRLHAVKRKTICADKRDLFFSEAQR